MGNTNGDQSGQHSSQGYIVGTGDRCVHSERPRSRKERNRGRWTQCNIQTTPLPSQTVRFFGSGKGFFFFVPAHSQRAIEDSAGAAASRVRFLEAQWVSSWNLLAVPRSCHSDG